MSERQETLSEADANRHHELFQDADADLVLRSSDGVKFGTHRLFLRTSSFFETMFGLPQAISELQLDEDSSIVEPVLILVSNLPFPP